MTVVVPVIRLAVAKLRPLAAPLPARRRRDKTRWRSTPAIAKLSFMVDASITSVVTVVAWSG